MTPSEDEAVYFSIDNELLNRAAIGWKKPKQYQLFIIWGQNVSSAAIAVAGVRGSSSYDPDDP